MSNICSTAGYIDIYRFVLCYIGLQCARVAVVQGKDFRASSVARWKREAAGGLEFGVEGIEGLG